MERVRALLRLWRREPHLGLPAALGALWLPVLPVYLWVRQFRYFVPDPDAFVYDFSYYYQAAQRFVADPRTLYADPEFFYPPPSVVAFLPVLALPAGWAYLAWVVLVMLGAAAAVALTWGLYERTTGERLAGPVRASLLLAGLASAPVFQNLRYGQVNVLVLLLALLFLRWHARRPVAAALALSGGFWLKLYPLALAPLALRGGRWGRSALGFALGLVALPLVLLPAVPWALHRAFWLERLPAWAGMTSQGALNQSVVGVLVRLRLPAEAALTAVDVPAPPDARALAAGLGAVLLGGLVLAALARRLPVEVTGLAVLALLPVLSALGWEHTYVLALPLYLWALVAARHRGPGARALAGAAMLVLMLPRPPHVALAWAVAHVPRPLLDLVLGRYIPVTLAVAAAVVAWGWRRGGTSGPVAASPAAT